MAEDAGDVQAEAARRATAYHEAGHATVAFALGRDVQRVSILPNQLWLGRCELKKGALRASKDPRETEVLILLGGLAAESRHTGRYAWGAAAHDLRGVESLLRTRARNERQLERLIRRLLDKTEYLLDDDGRWAAVESIAAELLKVTSLRGRAARHLFEQAVPRRG